MQPLPTEPLSSTKVLMLKNKAAKNYISEAEFFDIIGTKVFRAFLPTTDFTVPLPP